MTRREKRQLAFRMGTAVGIASTAIGGFMAFRLWQRRRSAGLGGFDGEFIRTAMELIADSVELGRVAGVHGADPRIQELGQRLVEHHSDDLSNLEEIAAFMSIPVRSEPSRHTRRLAKRLHRLSGPEFDRQFLDAIIDGHEDAISVTRQAQDLADKPELKAFADQFLTKLTTHLNAARERINEFQGQPANR